MRIAKAISSFRVRNKNQSCYSREGSAVVRMMWDVTGLNQCLGVRRVFIYPPRGCLGRIVMSYLGKVFDRSNRASIGFISFFVSFTPSAQVPAK